MILLEDYIVKKVMKEVDLDVCIDTYLNFEEKRMPTEW